MSEGLTLAKLIACKKLLDENECEPIKMMTGPTPAQRKAAVEFLASLTPRRMVFGYLDDSMNAAVLAVGKVDTFMGFTFIRSYKSLIEVAREYGITWHEARRLYWAGMVSVWRPKRR